jgi:hypothetical protein
MVYICVALYWTHCAHCQVNSVASRSYAGVNPEPCGYIHNVTGAWGSPIRGSPALGLPVLVSHNIIPYYNPLEKKNLTYEGLPIYFVIFSMVS